MKHLLLSIIATCWITVLVNAQVGINADNSTPDPSAMLDVKSTNKGILLPRMTTSQMMGISNPQAGLMVYNTTVNSACWFNGSSWDIGLNHDGQSGGTVTFGGQTYNSVIIGVQCWMKENLNIGTKINVTTNQTDNGVIEKYCYNNSDSMCNIYGGLYQWNELMNYTSSSNANPSGRQGICPNGWHVPSNAEWVQLFTYLGGSSVAGAAMKETGTTHWSSFNNNNATNSSGFTGLPGGSSSSLGTFSSLSTLGRFYSTSIGNGSTGDFPLLQSSVAYVVLSSCYGGNGASVRCMKD